MTKIWGNFSKKLEKFVEFTQENKNFQKKKPTSTYILATCWSNLLSKYGDFRNLATLAKNLNSIEVHPQSG